MMPDQGSLGLQLLWVVGWGALLSIAYFLTFRLVDLLPLGKDQRSRVGRLQPLAGLLLAFVFALYSVQTLFARSPEVLPYSRLLVLVAFFVGGYSFLREFFSGIAIRSEQSFARGDHIHVGGVRGRVVDFSARGIALETAEGDSVLVPYTRAASQEITRTQAADRGASTTFSFPLGDANFVTLKRAVERHALLHHWTCVARPPEVVLHDGQVEVTLFILSLEHAPLVKTALLKALSPSEPTK